MKKIKLSNKQKEVLSYLPKSGIVYMKGLNPHCFLTEHLQVKVPLPTFFKLLKLDLIKLKEDDWNSSTYILK